MELKTAKDYQSYFEEVFAKAMDEAMRNNADNEDYTKEDARKEATYHFLNDSTDYDAVAGIYIGYAGGKVDKALKDFCDEICNVEYHLTDEGKKKADKFIAELKAKRKEILDAGLDTADSTFIPVLEDIEDDVNAFGLDEDGDYNNCWGVTDNHESDYPLSLRVGTDVDTVITPTERDREVISKLEQILISIGSEKFKKLNAKYLKDGDGRDQLSEKDEKAYVNKTFKIYEEVGFEPVLPNVSGLNEEDVPYIGKPFKVTGRCKAPEWDLECLPAWNIEFEDGHKMEAYPEEICIFERWQR